MSLAHIAVRSAFGYVFLLALLRAAGKRTVVRGTAFEFVLALVIGDMVDDLLWGEVSSAVFVAGTATLTLAHTLVCWGKYWSPLFARVVEGSPRVILSDGKPVERALRKEHVAEGELEELLRILGVTRERWGDVERALLEDNGHPSLTPTEAARPATLADIAPGRRP
jgi:uncharacterized membrane protein YcaP (DUF421 family)